MSSESASCYRSRIRIICRVEQVYLFKVKPSKQAEHDGGCVVWAKVTYRDTRDLDTTE